MTLKENIQYLKMELENYSYEFRSIYEDFTSTSISSFSKRYQNFISNNNQVLIYTLTNGIEMTQNITFSIAMTRIPSTVFYVSTLIDESKEINMKERNTYELILCDFGSAKILEKNQSSIAYICSRYYRAPELIFGATQYNNQIDTTGRINQKLFTCFVVALEEHVYLNLATLPAV